jgi:hypothetical protein
MNYMEKLSISQERAEEIWSLVEHTATETQKKEVYLKIAAATVPALQYALGASEFKSGCVIQHLLDSEVIEAGSLTNDNFDAIYAACSEEPGLVLNPKEIPDIEFISKQPLTKETLPTICRKLVDDLLNQERAAYDRLVVAVGDKPYDKCHLFTRRQVDIIPMLDADTNVISLIAFELVCMALPFKNS